MQAHIEGRRDDGIKTLAKHAIAVGTDDIMADTHALGTVDTLVGIAQDEAVREIHLIIVIVTRLPIMEAVIGQAMLDTVFLQITLTRGGTGTLQTTGRFSLRLLAQIALLDDAEVALALLLGQHGHLDFGFDRLVGHDIEQVGLALL